MWSDRETENDCLGFASYVDVLADVCTLPDLAPLTLGVFGSWGSGKTSLMRMLNSRIETMEGMIASGEKTIETRRWSTKYRGPLLIVSSKEPNIAPAGFALAVVNLVDCRPMSVLDEANARCSKYDGAYAWTLEDVRPLDPIPVRGQPSLFDVDDDLVEQQLQDKVPESHGRKGSA